MDQSNLPTGDDIVDGSRDVGDSFQPHQPHASYRESYQPQYLSSRKPDQVPSPPPISSSTRFKSNNPFRSLVQDGCESDTHRHSNGETPCASRCLTCGGFPASTPSQNTLSVMSSSHHLLSSLTTLYGPGSLYVVAAEPPSHAPLVLCFPTYMTYVPQVASSFQLATHTGWSVPHMMPSHPHVIYFPSRPAGHYLQ
jgi:hypothetical protein